MTTGNSGYGNEGFTDYDDQLNWETVGSPVPKGDYDVEIMKAEYKPTSAGKHMAKVQYKIEQALQMKDEDPEAFQIRSEKCKDRMVFDNFVFTQEAGFRVKNFAEMAGIDLPTMVNKTVIEEWASSIVGIKVGVSLDHREWQGSIQASVKKCLPYGGVVQEEQQQQQQEEEQQVEEEQQAAPPPPAKPQQTLRQAVPPKANGTTNGAAHKPAPKPAAKSAKPQARR